MLVPTPTASYNACYSRDYLVHAATLPLPPELGYLMGILYSISDVAARGYCVLVLQYLFEACQGPRAGHGSRTCLYGLQTPPLGQHTLMRISETAAEGNSWPFLLPFLATSAREQLQISIAPSAPARSSLEKWLGKSGVGGGRLAVWVEDDAAFTLRAKGKYNVVELPVATDAGGAFQRGSDNCIEYPLAAHFVTNLMVAGHVKSVSSNDDAFIQCFRSSDKWLRIRASPF